MYLCENKKKEQYAHIKQQQQQQNRRQVEKAAAILYILYIEHTHIYVPLIRNSIPTHIHPMQTRRSHAPVCLSKINIHTAETN